MGPARKRFGHLTTSNREVPVRLAAIKNSIRVLNFAMAHHMDERFHAMSITCAPSGSVGRLCLPLSALPAHSLMSCAREVMNISGSYFSFAQIYFHLYQQI
jgi:hypothetical protein